MSWWWLAFSVVSNLAREIIKDLDDFQSDAMCGHLTWPVKLGKSFCAKCRHHHPGFGMDTVGTDCRANLMEYLHGNFICIDV